MALLERINSMKEQGFSEAQIQNNLINEGISPREINEAISQFKIKNAVASEGDMEQSIMTQNQNQQFVPVPEANTPTPTMQQYAQQPAQPVYQQYTQQPQAQPQEQAYAQQGYDQTYSQQGYDAQAYQQQAYAQQGYMPQGLDVETVRDISKQQVEESLKKLKEEISGLSKIKSEIKFEIQDIENRLKKVEDVMHELQSAIIRKMGEYGESIQGISKEIRATQDSFAKVINPLMDKKRGITHEESEEVEEIPQQEQISDEQAESNRPQPKGKKAQNKSDSRDQNSASFEDYFR